MNRVNRAGLRLIVMGGTIAFGASTAGAVPRLDGAALAGRANGVGVADRLDVVELSDASSIGMTGADLLVLAREVHRAVEAGVAGVVVTHGTDTLEETAYFLALTVPRGRIPVVLTGAMRHDDLPGADGPANLTAALLAAGTPALAGCGPVVVMADELHAARLVTKTHTASPAAFRSHPGALGQVAEGRVDVVLRPAYEDHLGLPDGADLPVVDLVGVHLGMDGSGLESALSRRPAGVVIQGFGGGHLAPRALAALDRLVACGIPVVVASRVGAGPTMLATYAVPGTELDLQRRGVRMAGDLSAVKARLRLAVALGLGIPVEAVFPVLP